MACKGDASEKCGAAWFLNVYKYTASVSANCTTPSLPAASVSGTATTASPIPSPTSTLPAQNSTVPVHNSTDSSEWYAHGCAVDANPRILNEFSNTAMANMTVDSCLNLCEEKGFSFAGVEYGEQCYCGSKLPASIKYADICQLPCKGNAKETCGGFWAMEVFELMKAGADCPVQVPAVTNIGNNNIVIPAPTATVSPAQTTPLNPAKTTTSSIVAPAPTAQPPSASGDRQVWAHHMVGNTYPYTQANWLVDIRAASAQAIDGFALNLGHESWQVDRATDAYAAAQNSGTGFKLFLSLDVTSLGCWSGGDASNLVSIVQRFANHPNQAKHNGKVLVSTFAGSDCNFGTGSGSGAWQSMFVDALKNQGTNIFFVPSIFSDISTFSGNSWMDGEVSTFCSEIGQG